jgi:hypothetical protein
MAQPIHKKWLKRCRSIIIIVVIVVVVVVVTTDV